MFARCDDSICCFVISSVLFMCFVFRTSLLWKQNTYFLYLAWYASLRPQTEFLGQIFHFDLQKKLPKLHFGQFLPAGAKIWTVHTQLLDTANNKPILEQVKSGSDVWCYVSNYPPRPYANLFVDFPHHHLFNCSSHFWSIQFDILEKAEWRTGPPSQTLSHFSIRHFCVWHPKASALRDSFL